MSDAAVIVSVVNLFRDPNIKSMKKMICPPLSGPETMIVWTTKGTTNAIQEAQAGRYHRQAA